MFGWSAPQSTTINRSLEDTILATAFEGKDGWLFLDGDTNRSVLQFTGKLTLSEETRQQWLDLMDVGEKLVGPGCYSFLIAPSKENVFPEFYPYMRVGLPMSQQMMIANSNCIVDPTEVLRSVDPFYTYDREETHWNDWGAYIAAKMLLQKLGFSAEKLHTRDFEERPFPASDLGLKMSPPRVGRTVSFVGKGGTAKLKYHNGITNWGHLSVFENESAPHPLNVLFFGDSFGTRMVKFIVRHFRRVVFAHATSIDLNLVDKEQPHLIVNEATDRFLPYFQSAADDFSFQSMISKKISGVPIEQERLSLISRQREYFENFV